MALSLSFGQNMPNKNPDLVALPMKPGQFKITAVKVKQREGMSQ